MSISYTFVFDYDTLMHCVALPNECLEEHKRFALSKSSGVDDDNDEGGELALRCSMSSAILEGKGEPASRTQGLSRVKTFIVGLNSLLNLIGPKVRTTTMASMAMSLYIQILKLNCWSKAEQSKN
jgi:hypothetical protein